jgi:UDP-glucuronate 4-epimerase
MSKRILVTGAAGFIGSHLVDRLLADGREVVGVDNFDPFYPAERKRSHLRDALRHPRFRLVEADILDAPAMADLIGEFRPGAIAHLAAKAGVRPSILAPTAYVRANIEGTSILLDAACALAERPKFILASSSSVYGDRTDAPFREDDAIDRPASPYAATKASCELMARTAHRIHGLPVTILRFFTAYGPRNRPDLAIAKFVRLIDAGDPIPVFGDGTTRRDYTYVEDIADGVARAIDRCSSLHVYNLGHSEPVALSEMIAAIGRALGKAPRLQHLPEQPGDVRLTYADVSRARSELGYRPETPFEAGLARYVAWLRAEEERPPPVPCSPGATIPAPHGAAILPSGCG